MGVLERQLADLFAQKTGTDEFNGTVRLHFPIDLDPQDDASLGQIERSIVAVTRQFMPNLDLTHFSVVSAGVSARNAFADIKFAGFEEEATGTEILDNRNFQAACILAGFTKVETKDAILEIPAQILTSAPKPQFAL